jgi:O-antigen/teichoic acid export membrane protein
VRAPSHHPGLRRRLIESLAWQSGSALVAQCISWLATLVVIRLLSPEDYGLVALGGIVFTLMLQGFDFGIGPALVQARELSREDVRPAQSLILVLGLGSGLLVMGSSPILANLYDEPRIMDLSIVLGLTVPIVALSVVPQSIAVRELRFDLKARADLVTALCSSGTTLLLAHRGAGPWALIGGIIATHLSRAVVYPLLGGARIRPSLSLAPAQRFVQFGRLLSLDRLLWFVFTNVDLLIVGKLLGESALGVYVVTLTLCSLPLDKLSPLFTQVALPVFSRVQDEPLLIRSAAVAGIRYAFLVFVPIAWGAALVAPEGLPLLLGEQWKGAVLPFQLICAVLPLRSLGALMSPVLIGTGLIRTNVENLAITCVVMGASFLVGARHGLEGMAFAWLLGFPLVSALTFSRSLRALQISPRKVLDGVRSAIAAGLALVLAAAAVRSALSGAPLFSLAGSVLAGAAAYLGVVRWLEPGIVAEIRALIRPRAAGAAGG